MIRQKKWQKLCQKWQTTRMMCTLNKTVFHFMNLFHNSNFHATLRILRITLKRAISLERFYAIYPRCKVSITHMIGNHIYCLHDATNTHCYGYVSLIKFEQNNFTYQPFFDFHAKNKKHLFVLYWYFGLNLIYLQWTHFNNQNKCFTLGFLR